MATAIASASGARFKNGIRYASLDDLRSLLDSEYCRLGGLLTFCNYFAKVEDYIEFLRDRVETLSKEQSETACELADHMQRKSVMLQLANKVVQTNAHPEEPAMDILTLSLEELLVELMRAESHLAAIRKLSEDCEREEDENEPVHTTAPVVSAV